MRSRGSGVRSQRSEGLPPTNALFERTNSGNVALWRDDPPSDFLTSGALRLTDILFLSPLTSDLRLLYSGAHSAGACSFTGGTASLAGSNQSASNTMRLLTPLIAALAVSATMASAIACRPPQRGCSCSRSLALPWLRFRMQ